MSVMCVGKLSVIIHPLFNMRRLREETLWIVKMKTLTARLPLLDIRWPRYDCHCSLVTAGIRIVWSVCVETAHYQAYPQLTKSESLAVKLRSPQFSKAAWRTCLYTKICLLLQLGEKLWIWLLIKNIVRALSRNWKTQTGAVPTK